MASALRVAECLVTPLELGLLDLEVGAVNGGEAPRQSGISLEEEKRSVDPRGVATASGGASILCSWLVAREAFAGLSIARRSPPARGRERLTKAVGLEMLDRRAATAETRKASVKAIGKR